MKPDRALIMIICKFTECMLHLPWVAGGCIGFGDSVNENERV